MSDVLRCSTGFGVPVGLRMPAADETTVRGSLPFWWAEEDAVLPRRVWEVRADAHVADVIGEVELYVAEHAPGLVFVHAGVVALGERALLLPGRSLSGKSTLVAELLRRGATYSSDEYAVLQPDGRVRAYPRRVTLRSETSRTYLTAEALGAATTTRPVTVGMIAALEYRPNGPPAYEPISAGQAALRLLDNAVCAVSRPHDALTAVTAAARTAFAIGGTRGEADAVAPDLIALLRG